MAGFMGETYMLQALQNGLSQVRANPELLTDILDALNSNELAAAKQYFGNSANVINLAPGFPMEQTQLPFIGVTIATDNQITEQTPIGFVYERINNGDGTWTDIRGARYVGNLKATIYSQNADVIVWLSAVCAWSLISQYDTLLGFGLSNLQSGLGDYEPSPQWLPFYTFTRGVFLTSEYDKTYTASPSVVTSSVVTADFSILNSTDTDSM